MTATDIPAIDVHGHYGTYLNEAQGELGRLFMSADPETVIARAKAANTSHTVVSPLLGLLPRGGADAAVGNEEAAGVVEKFDGLLQWVIVNPLQPETYDQAARMLKQPKCVGIKIHPEEHIYPIAEHGRAIFDFASQLQAVILTHTGESNSLPRDFVPLADEFPRVNLILAHLGNSGAEPGCDLQVRAIQAARHDNVFVDTSSARSMFSGLVEWAVGEVGAERILYGSDTPLYFAPSQRARIDHSDLSLPDKRLILRENAQRLLNIS